MSNPFVTMIAMNATFRYWEAGTTDPTAFDAGEVRFHIIQEDLLALDTLDAYRASQSQLQTLG